MDMATKCKNQEKYRFSINSNRINSMRSNYIQTKIDKMHLNTMYCLCCERDETDNRIISECNKLSENKYQSRHDWVEKAIHWEFGTTNK